MQNEIFPTNDLNMISEVIHGNYTHLYAETHEKQTDFSVSQY